MNARDRSPSVFGRWLRPLLVGLCVGLLCCTALLLLMARLVGSVDVPRQAVMPLAIVAAAVAALAAGFTAARLAGKNGLLLGAACGLLLFLIILIAGFARYAGVDGGTAVIKLAALVVAAGFGGLLGVNRRSR